MFKDLKIGDLFYKNSDNVIKPIKVENIYEDTEYIVINMRICFSHAYGKSNKSELCLNKKNKEHLLSEIIRQNDAVISKYYLSIVSDFENEADEIIDQFEQCNVCGLTDDHSMECPNNNSPFNELITNGYD